MAYTPQAATATLLDAAWRYVQSVPYKVSARWLFYRLLQDGHVSTKADYKRVISVLSRARKEFHGGWRPDTLADDSRQVRGKGTGYRTLDQWLDAFTDDRVFSYADGRDGMVSSYVDRWMSQPYFVVVCFEAAAMSGQFDHYLPPFVTRVAFKGDVSIPAKWELAQLVARGPSWYDRPSVIVYFGDLDPKGLVIPESAMADIRVWATTDMEYVRAGLNPGDEARYDIAENPERPGTYQWEALDDDTAGTLIADAIAPYVDIDAGEEAEQEDARRLQAFSDWWADNRPTAEDLGLQGGNDEV